MTDLPDPTGVRNQPALTTSTGLVWLVLGAFLTGICVAVLFGLVALEPVVAWIGLTVVICLYLTLLVVRFAVPAGRKRLLALASVFGAIAVVTLICVVVISGSAWGSLR